METKREEKYNTAWNRFKAFGGAHYTLEWTGKKKSEWQACLEAGEENSTEYYGMENTNTGKNLSSERETGGGGLGQRERK